MQALILAGGEGTRLRPLTATVPKPVVSLANRPFISYMLDWLADHGFDDIVMSCGFLADGVRAVLGEGEGTGVRIRYVTEPEPLGTAGAVKFAEGVLDDRFAVLNGDVLTDFDLSALRDFHAVRGARATIALMGVDDPSAYGLVTAAPDGSVEEFLEKPEPGVVGRGLINAGAYMVERGVLDGIAAGRPVSFEREVFPALVGAGLYACEVTGYWLDIGTPERYLQGTRDILSGAVRTHVSDEMGTDGIGLGEGAAVDSAAVVSGPALVGAGSRVAAGARVGPDAVLGAQSRVGADAVVEDAVLHAGAELGQGAVVRESIVGPGARVGAGAQLGECTIVGEGAEVPPGAVLRNARVEGPA